MKRRHLKRKKRFMNIPIAKKIFNSLKKKESEKTEVFCH